MLCPRLSSSPGHGQQAGLSVVLLADDAVAVGLDVAAMCLDALALGRGVWLVIHRQAVSCPAAVQHGAGVAHVGRVQSLQARGRISGSHEPGPAAASARVAI